MKTNALIKNGAFATGALVSAAMLIATPVAVGQTSGDQSQRQRQSRQMHTSGQHQYGQMQRQQASSQDKLLLRANKLMDKTVYSQQGDQKLGKITNVVFDSDSGDIVYAVLAGQQDGNMYALPWNVIEIEDHSAGSSQSMGDRQRRGAASDQASHSQRDRMANNRSMQSSSDRNADQTRQRAQSDQRSDDSQRRASNADQNSPFGRREAYPHDVDAADTDRGRAFDQQQASNNDDRNREQSDRMTAQQVADAQTRDSYNQVRWRSSNESNAYQGGGSFDDDNQSRMKYSEGDFRLTASISQDQLRQAEGFSEGNWPDMANRQRAEDTHRQYGEQPYWERDRSWLSDDNNDQSSQNSNARQGSDELWPLVKATDVKNMTVVQGDASSGSGQYAFEQDRASQNRQANNRTNRGQFSAQRDDGQSGTQLSQGDEIGTVQDVIIADKSGKVAYLIIDASEALEGEKSLIAVPADEVEFSGKNDSLSLNRSFNGLENKAFAEGERPNFGNRGMAAGSFDEGTEWVVLGYEVVQIVPVSELESGNTDSQSSAWSRQNDRRGMSGQSGSQDRNWTQSDRSSQQSQRDAMNRDRSSAQSDENNWSTSRNDSAYGQSGQDAKEITGKVQSVEREGQNLTLVVKTDDGETKRLSLGEEQRLTEQGVRFEQSDEIVAHVESDASRQSTGQGQNAAQSNRQNKGESLDVTRIRQKSSNDDMTRQRSSIYGSESDSGQDGASY